MSQATIVFEQIVGVIAFLSAELEAPHAKEKEGQWKGIFRVPPEEDLFQAFKQRICNLHSHREVKRAIMQEPVDSSVVLASRLLKWLLAQLDTPLLPMDFSIQPYHVDEAADRAKIGSDLAESYLQAMATAHSPVLAPINATTGAQLLALLCEVSRKEAGLTLMSEYNLAVVLIPSISGGNPRKNPTMEDLQNEQRNMMTFQSNHRNNITCRLEAMIKYGRRIWGVIHECLKTGNLQATLQEAAQVSRLDESLNSTSASIYSARRQSVQYLKRVMDKIRHPVHGPPEAEPSPSTNRRNSLAPFRAMSRSAFGSSSSMLNVQQSNGPQSNGSHMPPPPVPPRLKKSSESNLDGSIVTSAPKPLPPLPARRPSKSESSLLDTSSLSRRPSESMNPSERSMVSASMANKESAMSKAISASATKRRFSKESLSNSTLDPPAKAPPSQLEAGVVGGKAPYSTLPARMRTSFMSKKASLNHSEQALVVSRGAYPALPERPHQALREVDVTSEGAKSPEAMLFQRRSSSNSQRPLSAKANGLVETEPPAQAAPSAPRTENSETNDRPVSLGELGRQVFMG